MFLRSGARRGGFRELVAHELDVAAQIIKLPGKGCRHFHFVDFLLDAPELGLELAAALHKFYPMGFDTSHMNQLLVNQAAFKALLAGEDPHRIAEDWQDKLNQFMETRAKYLIY